MLWMMPSLTAGVTLAEAGLELTSVGWTADAAGASAATADVPDTEHVTATVVARSAALIALIRLSIKSLVATAAQLVALAWPTPSREGMWIELTSAARDGDGSVDRRCDPVEDVVFAHDESGGTGAFEHSPQHQRAGRNDIDPAWVDGRRWRRGRRGPAKAGGR